MLSLPHRLCLLLALFCSIAAGAAEPLPAEQAFRFSARVVDRNTIEAHWDIEDGYYLYRSKFRFAADPATVKLQEAKFPAGEMHDDENFGKVETYRKSLSVLIPVDGTAGKQQLILRVVSQGCADMGICYPPQNQQASLSLPDRAGAVALPPLASSGPANDIAAEMPPAFSSTSQGSVAPASSRVAALLNHGSFWVVLTSFFGFGLLLSFTPCMLPMVPIISGIIVNHGHAVTHARAFMLSLVYVLGMAVTYAAAGVAAGYSGTLLSSLLQNAWVLGGFALIFIALALAMFGLYELQLPSALQSRISASANRQGGSLHAIALMGALSALIVGPCVAPPLAGALLYIAKTGDSVLGGSALFAMSLGMGAPLLAVGVFSRSLLPRTGPWMDAVKKLFGVILLATALWLVTPVLPLWLQMLGWAALLILPAIYLHALDPLPAHAHGWHKLGKGIGVVMLLAGSAMLLGVLGGAREPLQPLGFLRGAPATAAAELKFQSIRSVDELDAMLKTATRPVMLDYYADWCVSCKEMERETFNDPRVASVLGKLTLLRADITASSSADEALRKRFEVTGPPALRFFNRAGEELHNRRIDGYLGPDEFLDALRTLAP